MPDISSSLSKREVNARQNTYTKSEIDLKDGAIQAIAEAAQTTADAAEKKNQEQDQLIAELQKSSHSHSNRDVLDKIEQPYTTAERDKLAGLENYTHPTYTAHAKGFYKFASDGEGHVEDAETVTKKDITALGIPSENTRYKFTVDGTGLEINQSTSADFYRLKFPSTRSITSLIPYFPNTYDNERGYCWCQLAFTVVESTAHDYKKIGIEGGYEQGERIYYKPQGVAKIAIALYGVAGRRGISITADLPLHNAKLFEVRPLENLKIFSSAPEKKLSVYAVGRYNSIDTSAGGKTNYDLYLFLYADESYTATAPGVRVTVETSVYPFDGHCSDVNRNYSNVVQLDSSVISESIRMSAAKVEAVTDILANKADKSEIPDISGKQDKSTAVTHTANTAVGSATKPVYIAANGAATPISHSINSDVPANAKFTDTTYSDATQSAHGLMTAADKKKLDGIAAGATKVAVDSALSATSTNPVQNKAVKAALDSKAASGHTHAMITNSALWVSGANNTAKWVKLGTLVSSGNFSNAMIRVWSGDGANGRANQNSSFEVQIKDGWQSTESATKACGVTVYRVGCSSVKVKVIPTAHDTYTVWAYMPWGYWNGNYAVYGKYKSWTSQHLIQSEEPEGTGADTAYYDQAFLTSTVAKATEATTLTDSGWQKPTFPSGVKSSSIRYRKQGKIVSVTGYVQFSAEQTTITVFTLPTGYRPPEKIQQFNAVDSSAQASFLTKIDTDGKVGFFGKTRGFFTTATEYYMHCTFFVD
ncbi:hypothetical protein [Ruminococcus sp.]